MGDEAAQLQGEKKEWSTITPTLFLWTPDNTHIQTEDIYKYIMYVCMYSGM